LNQHSAESPISAPVVRPVSEPSVFRLVARVSSPALQKGSSPSPRSHSPCGTPGRATCPGEVGSPASCDCIHPFERRLRLCDPEVGTVNSPWELTVGSSSKEKLPLHGSGASHGLTTASPTTEKSLTLRDTMVRLCWRAVAASRASMTERGRPFICAWARSNPQRSEMA